MDELQQFLTDNAQYVPYLLVVVMGQMVIVMKKLTALQLDHKVTETKQTDHARRLSMVEKIVHNLEMQK